MDKKSLKIILIALLILIALPLLALGGNRLVFHRSFSATMFEWQLRSIGRDSMPDGGKAWLAENAVSNAGPCLLPEGIETEHQHFYYGEDDMECFLFIPEHFDPDRLVVCFSGGTYIDKPTASHWLFADAVAHDTGVRVLNIVYPKLPDHTAPEACAILSGFYSEVIEAQGCETVIFLGDSAGGGMALALAQERLTAGLDGPDRLVLLSPWVDVSMENEALAAYAPRDPKLDPETLRFAGSLWAGSGSVTKAPASPLYGELEGLCPMSIYVGTRELLYPDVIRFAEAAEQAGCEVRLNVGRGMNHVWPLFQCYGVKEAVSALHDIEQTITS